MLYFILYSIFKYNIDICMKKLKKKWAVSTPPCRFLGLGTAR